MQKLPALVAALLVAAACGTADPGYTIDRRSVWVAVQPDGSAFVEERLTLRFNGTQLVTSFEWRAPRTRYDERSDLVVIQDGGRLIEGTGPGTYRIGTGSDLDVTWVFAASSRGTRELIVRYHVTNVVEVAGLRGRVSWLACPAGRGLDIGSSTIGISLPERATFTEDPWVEEAGWDVKRTDNGMTASKAAVGRNERATAGVAFSIAGLDVHPPRWQVEADRATEFVPAFVAMGASILVVGVGVLAMMWLKFGRIRENGEARPGDAERRAAARDLARAGVAVFALGLALAAATAWLPLGFGPWAYAVGGSVTIVGVMFMSAARLFAPR